MNNKHATVLAFLTAVLFLFFLGEVVICICEFEAIKALAKNTWLLVLIITGLISQLCLILTSLGVLNVSSDVNNIEKKIKAKEELETKKQQLIEEINNYENNQKQKV